MSTYGSTNGAWASRAALAALLLPGGAAAQELTLPAGAPGQLAAGAVVIGVMLAFLWGAWRLLRLLARDLQAAAPGGAAGRLLELPLGVPEGSVRALLSVFIIVFGFLLLAFAGPLGLRAGEALTGFIGAVISFYFASRAGERSAQTAQDAREAARVAGEAVARAADALGAAPASTPDAPVAELRGAERRLQSLRSLLAAAAGAAAGTGALEGAGAALQRVDHLLTRIAPLLEGRADAEAVGRLAAEAASLLADLGDLGPVGTAFADAAATIGAVAAESAPIARGIGALLGGTALAGPAGLVAALAIGGLGLVRERERFDRWKAAMLDTPLDLGLLPPAVDAGLATAALLRTPALAGRLAPGGTIEPALALSVWDAMGTRAGEIPAPAAEVAARILAGAGPAELRAIFAGSPEALAEAIEDLRAAMTGAAALAGLGLPGVELAGAEVPTAALADAVRVARGDGRAAAELDRVTCLVEALRGVDAGTLARLAARLGAPGFWQGVVPAGAA